MKRDSYLTSYTNRKSNSGWTADPRVKGKTITLQDNTRKQPGGPEGGKGFLDMTGKVLTIKEKVDKARTTFKLRTAHQDTVQRTIIFLSVQLR